METYTYHIRGSNDLPKDVCDWLEFNIDGNKDKIKDLIVRGVVGEGRRKNNDEPLQPLTFQIYWYDLWDRINIYWNDGSKCYECAVALYFSKTTSRNQSFDTSKYSHAECACG